MLKEINISDTLEFVWPVRILYSNIFNMKEFYLCDRSQITFK